MEYPDTINGPTSAAAVSVAIALKRRGSFADSAAEAVSKTFCVCVTDGEDAAEHRFSGTHRELIDEAVARMRSADALPRAQLTVGGDGL